MENPILTTSMHPEFVHKAWPKMVIQRNMKLCTETKDAKEVKNVLINRMEKAGFNQVALNEMKRMPVIPHTIQTNEQIEAGKIRIQQKLRLEEIKGKEVEEEPRSNLDSQVNPWTQEETGVIDNNRKEIWIPIGYHPAVVRRFQEAIKNINEDPEMYFWWKSLMTMSKCEKTRKEPPPKLRAAFINVGLNMESTLNQLTKPGERENKEGPSEEQVMRMIREFGGI